MAYTGTNSAQRTSAGSTTFANSIFGVAESTTGSTTTYFAHDANGTLNNIVGGGTHYYVFYDGAGSVAGIFNTSGTQEAAYSYDPFGTTTASGADASYDPFRFKGGYQDTSGFYKFGTRYYNSTTASWTQQDSIAGTIQNPSAVNRYPYAGDDPVNEVDPNGASFFGAIANAYNHVNNAVNDVGAAIFKNTCTAVTYIASAAALAALAAVTKNPWIAVGVGVGLASSSAYICS
jgi:RHS repeat-associated protein